MVLSGMVDVRFQTNMALGRSETLVGTHGKLGQYRFHLVKMREGSLNGQEVRFTLIIHVPR